MTLVSRVSTRSVGRDDRIAFWEEYNRRALVGLTCSSYSPDGLLAAQTNHRLGGLRLAGITGNEHVIERTPRICRELPKDSVFVSVLTAGQAVFFHEGGCLTLRAGDAVLYDTRGPYLFGFPTAMRKLLVDIPREVFAERCLPGPGLGPGFGLGPGDLRTPLLFKRTAASKAPAPLEALRTVLTDWTAGRTDDDPTRTETTVLDLVHTLAAPHTGDDPAPTTGPARLALAHQYIDRHLTDPRLAPDRVAAALGISTRHLGRLFAPSGTTPARHILDRRLTRAYDQLTDPAARGRTVAEIAHHWGFATQAHFTRVFRARYGRTPGETRPHPRAGEARGCGRAGRDQGAT